MNDDMDKILKKYFEKEVNEAHTPSMPFIKKINNKKTRWDNLLMAACVLGCFILIMSPATYNNAIRKSYVPISKYEAFKERFPRVIFEASLYFKEKIEISGDRSESESRTQF